jgi:hypothetical protein
MRSEAGGNPVNGSMKRSGDGSKLAGARLRDALNK